MVKKLLFALVVMTSFSIIHGVNGSPSSLLQVTVEVEEQAQIQNVSKSFGFIPESPAAPPAPYRLSLVNDGGEVEEAKNFSVDSVISYSPSDQYCVNTTSGYKCNNTVVERQEQIHTVLLDLSFRAEKLRLSKGGKVIETVDVRQFVHRCGDNYCDPSEEGVCPTDCKEDSSKDSTSTQDTSTTTTMLWVIGGSLVAVSSIVLLSKHLQSKSDS